MDIEKKEYLTIGTPNEKTKEKIRLNLSLLLNGHKKCILGLTPMKDIPRLAYEFEMVGYKHLFFIYKSTSVNKIEVYLEQFQSMYLDELILDQYQDIKKPEKAIDDGLLLIYLLGKSKKRVF